ncbi:hypothetical protein Aduo_001339 [Ancylostoma duodenale]
MELPHQPTKRLKATPYIEPALGRVRFATLRLHSRYRRLDARAHKGSTDAVSTTLLTPTPDRLNVNLTMKSYS